MIIRRLSPWNTNPYARLDEMRREMQRLFEDVDSDVASGPSGVFPPINVTEDENSYYARAEIPGVDASAVELSAHHNTLELRGERKAPAIGERSSYHRRERPEGQFQRSLSLPTDVDTDGIEASYSDGILTIVVPKAEHRKPRHISVKSS